MTDDTPKFTPVPWYMSKHDAIIGPPYNVYKGFQLIAQVDSSQKDHGRANAALIAQSPAMYAELNGASVFLRTLAEVLEVTFQHDSRKEYAENALRLAKNMKERADGIDALLKKARGEA